MTTNTTENNELRIQFTQDERERLHAVKPLRLLIDLSLPWIQILIGIGIFLSQPGLWTWFLSMIVIAGGQHGLSLITHEAAHRLLWPKNKRTNDFIASVFFAAPVALPFQVYRHRHLIHHRLVSRGNDTKTLYRRNIQGWRFILEIVRSLSGADYCQQAIEALRYGKQGQSAQFSARLRKDQGLIILVHAIIFLMFLLIDPLYYTIPVYYFILWIIPLVSFSFLFGKLRSIAEHQPCENKPGETPSGYFNNSPRPVLRSVKASWLERMILSKINFHFHAEHHLWPWISYQNLPEVNSRIWKGTTGAIIIKDNDVSMEKSYFTILTKLISG